MKQFEKMDFNTKKPQKQHASDCSHTVVYPGDWASSVYTYMSLTISMVLLKKCHKFYPIMRGKPKKAIFCTKKVRNENYEIKLIQINIRIVKLSSITLADIYN